MSNILYTQKRYDSLCLPARVIEALAGDIFLIHDLDNVTLRLI